MKRLPDAVMMTGGDAMPGMVGGEASPAAKKPCNGFVPATLPPPEEMMATAMAVDLCEQGVPQAFYMEGNPAATACDLDHAARAPPPHHHPVPTSGGGSGGCGRNEAGPSTYVWQQGGIGGGGGGSGALAQHARGGDESGGGGAPSTAGRPAASGRRQLYWDVI